MELGVDWIDVPRQRLPRADVSLRIFGVNRKRPSLVSFSAVMVFCVPVITFILKVGPICNNVQCKEKTRGEHESQNAEKAVPPHDSYYTEKAGDEKDIPNKN